jgi:hypothetical protein
MRRNEMKPRLLLVLCLFLGGGPAYGEWVKIATTDQGMTAYVDLATIHRTGNLVMLWALVDFETVRGNSSLSRKEQVECDCVNERHRLLAGAWFSEHMGHGDVDAIDSDESKWNSVEPESIPQMLWKVACNKP